MKYKNMSKSCDEHEERKLARTRWQTIETVAACIFLITVLVLVIVFVPKEYWLKAKKHSRTAESRLNRSLKITFSQWVYDDRDIGGNTCYMVPRSVPATFTAAKKRCEQSGGHLASIYDSSGVFGSFAYRFQYQFRNKDIKLWMGMQRDRNGTVRGLDGEKMEVLAATHNLDLDESHHLQWAPGEPKNFTARAPPHGKPNSGNKTCVEQSMKGGRLYSQNCLKMNYYVCAAAPKKDYIWGPCPPY